VEKYLKPFKIRLKMLCFIYIDVWKIYDFTHLSTVDFVVDNVYTKNPHFYFVEKCGKLIKTA
jgi:hypothetical protein